jgi:starch synthase
MVTRLDSQKGVDLVLEALDTLADVAWAFVLLGTGEPALEQQAEAFAKSRRGRAGVALRFDAALSRRIFGGADMLLVPSRYEPCGLAQLIAMRYGCLPIVRATGGLKDTVRDDDAGEGTGFTFRDPTPEGLAQAIRRAISAYSDKARWGKLQQRAMASDFSWRRSAEKYAGLYRRAVDRRRAAQR